MAMSSLSFLVCCCIIIFVGQLGPCLDAACAQSRITFTMTPPLQQQLGWLWGLVYWQFLHNTTLNRLCSALCLWLLVICHTTCYLGNYYLNSGWKLVTGSPPLPWKLILTTVLNVNKTSLQSSGYVSACGTKNTFFINKFFWNCSFPMLTRRTCYCVEWCVPPLISLTKSKLATVKSARIAWGQCTQWRFRIEI